MKHLIVAVIIVFSLLRADFNRTGTYIDIPDARLMPPNSFKIGLDASTALGSGVNNDDFDLNFHMSGRLVLPLECYLDVYETKPFSIAAGGRYGIVCKNTFALSAGIHSLSFTSNVSERGNDDTLGWSDDRTYNRNGYKKPFENASVFASMTWVPVFHYRSVGSGFEPGSALPATVFHERVSVTFGIGRGRYVGYGTHSHFFNTNAFRDQGGDWGIGVFAGGKISITDAVSYVIEGDGRDLNTGFILRFLPVELALAASKIEYWFWPAHSYQPRFSFAVSYVQAREYEEVMPGMIAGTVTDKNGAGVENAFIILNVPEAVTTRTDAYGNFAFPRVYGGAYTVHASHDEYETAEASCLVKDGRETRVAIVLDKPPVKTGAIVGVTVDYKSAEPLVTDVELENTGLSAVTDSLGRFEFRGLNAGTYRIKAQAFGYETCYGEITVVQEQQTETTIQLVKKGMVITIQGIQFEFNRAEIMEGSYAVLDEAAAILTNSPDIRVEIQGHTDAIGSETYNKKLSQMRAESVRDYLVLTPSIESVRLNARGYGESKPVATNKTVAGRGLNRRVDFAILEQ